MSFRILTVQFAVPDHDPMYRVTGLRDMIQESLYDEQGCAGSFRVVGAQDAPGNEATATAFMDRAFDPASVRDNADALIEIEAQIMALTPYQVGGYHEGSDSFSFDGGGCRPYRICDTRSDGWLPGDFDSREEAETQATRMNAAIRAEALAQMGVPA